MESLKNSFNNVKDNTQEIRDQARNSARRVQAQVTGESPPDPDVLDQCCPNMSMQNRVIGWLVCFGIGILLQLLSFTAIGSILTGKAKKFAILYTLGNICALGGTFFVCGPKTQIRRMTKKNRLGASLAFIISLVLTLVVAFVAKFPGRTLLILILVLIQWLAIIWYTLSYIPFARQGAMSCMRRCIGLGPANDNSVALSA